MSPALATAIANLCNQATNNRTDKMAYSVDTFCERNDIGRSTAYEEIKNGRLRAVKVGRRTLIREEDERAWLAALPSLQTAANASRASQYLSIPNEENP